MLVLLVHMKLFSLVQIFFTLFLLVYSFLLFSLVSIHCILKQIDKYLYTDSRGENFLEVFERKMDQKRKQLKESGECHIIPDFFCLNSFQLIIISCIFSALCILLGELQSAYLNDPLFCRSGACYFLGIMCCLPLWPSFPFFWN